MWLWLFLVCSPFPSYNTLISQRLPVVTFIQDFVGISFYMLYIIGCCHLPLFLFLSSILGLKKLFLPRFGVDTLSICISQQSNQPHHRSKNSYLQTQFAFMLVLGKKRCMIMSLFLFVYWLIAFMWVLLKLTYNWTHIVLQTSQNTYCLSLLQTGLYYY